MPAFSEDVFGWNRRHRGSAPVAEARLWQAEDGALAIFFANYGEERVPFRYRIDPGRSGGQGTPVEGSVTLEPASVRVLELPR